MSLTDTRKLLQQSRKIVEEADENTSVNVILNMILRLVTSIDTRLQGVEKCFGKFDELKNIITSLTSRVVTAEKSIKECQSKIKDLENGIEGVGNLYDNIKSLCDKNKNSVAKVGDQYEIVKDACNRNKADIKRVSEQLEAKISTGAIESCDCKAELQNLRSTVVDLQCRSMKNNLIFTGLWEVRNENTEELLRTFLYQELGIEYRIEFGNVHRFSHKPRGKRPIVARFIYHSDLQFVLESAYRLRNTPYGIRQQFPREIEDNRRKLYPVQKEAKRQGKNAVLVRDRLYIDNNLYVASENETERMDLPEQIRPSPESVWTTPTHRGQGRPPKRPRFSSSTPNGR